MTENPRQNVTFPSNGGTAHGYLATPESGSGPGVIVIQEWWGLTDHIVSIADRLAPPALLGRSPCPLRGPARRRGLRGARPRPVRRPDHPRRRRGDRAAHVAARRAGQQGPRRRRR